MGADGKIAWVGDSASASEAKGAFVVEGVGLYLSPGLVDLHVPISNLSEHLLPLVCGTTTVRDIWLDRANLDPALEELARLKGEAAEAFTFDKAKADGLVAEVQKLAARDIFLDPMELKPAFGGLRQPGFGAADKLQPVVSESAKLK